MQVFVFVHEAQEVVVVTTAADPKVAIKQLAKKMSKLKRGGWSSDPADYEDDLDNGVWAMYDGPQTKVKAEPFTAWIHHFA